MTASHGVTWSKLSLIECWHILEILGLIDALDVHVTLTYTLTNRDFLDDTHLIRCLLGCEIVNGGVSLGSGCSSGHFLFLLVGCVFDL
jgi:hypothetical protein